jgi:hypothetical protein
MNIEKALAWAIVVGSPLAVRLVAIMSPTLIIILAVVLAAHTQNLLLVALVVLAASLLFGASIGTLAA